ncbi:MAG: oligosaccharide flippase family protein [Blastochloris sp.]|nr:oligosaccharide flippase family protein [Blastochloris sp.]
MSSLRKQTLWSMLPVLVTAIVGIATVPLYFRVLGDQMYAMWFYVGTLTGAFGFMDLGLGVAVGRYMGVALGANDQNAAKEYWATGNVIVLPFLLLFTAVFIVVGTVFGPSWFKVSGHDATILRWAVLWGGFGLFFAYYGQMWHSLAQTHLDFKYLAILRTWFSLLASLGSVVVALWTRNVAAIFAFTSCLALIQFALLFYRGQHHYQLPLKLAGFKKNRFKEMLPYTLKTCGQLLSGSVLGSLDRIFLGRVAPALDFAVFNVSINIGGRLSSLSTAAMGPIFNNTTRGVGGDQSRKPADIYRESFNLMFPWYSLAMIGVFFWSAPVTEVWLGAKYGTAVGQVFPWVVAGLCLNALASISTAQTGSLNRVGTGLIIQSSVSLLALAFVLLGWFLHGIVGAAIGFFCARLFLFFQDALVRKWIGIPLSEYYSAVLVILRQLALVGGLWLAFNLFTTQSLILLVGCAFCVLAASLIELRILWRSKK